MSAALDVAAIAGQFGLGEPVAVTTLAGGGRGVLRLTATGGDFVLKPACRMADPALGGSSARRGRHPPAEAVADAGRSLVG